MCTGLGVNVVFGFTYADGGVFVCKVQDMHDNILLILLVPHLYIVI